MYKDFHLDFNIGKLKKTITYSIGVHQGDNLAPIIFNIFFESAISTLTHAWQENKINSPSFHWFLNNLHSRLLQQRKVKGQTFQMWKSLYVDDGAFLFENRKELKKGANVIFSHLKRFGLTMHVGTDGTFWDSKTKAVHFLAPREPTENIDTSPVPVADGYITYNSRFIYL